jgi:ADP-heptose:LPS heptosyltransferase
MNLRRKLVVDYYVGGIAHVLLKPFVMLLGRILRRDHSLEFLEELAIVKMLGGGSLIIAYPSLLALKKSLPKIKLKLVTTSAIYPFAELTGLFDEVIVIRDDSTLHLVVDSIKAIRNLWRARALLDLEIHSRLSSIFSLLTCSINRIGIYTDVSFWRKSLYTHLLFYNKSSPVYSLYDQIVHLLGVDEVAFASAQLDFRTKINQLATACGNMEQGSIGVAPGCSIEAAVRQISSLPTILTELSFGGQIEN